MNNHERRIPNVKTIQIDRNENYSGRSCSLKSLSVQWRPETVCSNISVIDITYNCVSVNEDIEIFDEGDYQIKNKENTEKKKNQVSPPKGNLQTTSKNTSSVNNPIPKINEISFKSNFSIGIVSNSVDMKLSLGKQTPTPQHSSSESNSSSSITSRSNHHHQPEDTIQKVIKQGCFVSPRVNDIRLGWGSSCCCFGKTKERENLKEMIKAARSTKTTKTIISTNNYKSTNHTFKSIIKNDSLTKYKRKRTISTNSQAENTKSQEKICIVF